MLYKYFLFIMFIVVISCSQSTHFERDTEIQSINTVLINQQSAWNEGDIDKFMEGYWKSDSLSFIGSRGLSLGWNNTLENYKKGYPDKSAMGILTFEIVELIFLSDNIAKMIGKYSLQREKDNPKGYFTLVWTKISGKWLIISDHTCG